MLQVMDEKCSNYFYTYLYIYYLYMLNENIKDEYFHPSGILPHMKVMKTLVETIGT